MTNSEVVRCSNAKKAAVSSPLLLLEWEDGDSKLVLLNFWPISGAQLLHCFLDVLQLHIHTQQSTYTYSTGIV